MKGVQHIATGMFPDDFELKGGDLNLDVTGYRLWLCYNGECMIRVRGFKKFTVNGEPLETVKELREQLDSISEDEFPPPRKPHKLSENEIKRWKEYKERLRQIRMQTGLGTGAIVRKSEKPGSKNEQT